MKHALMMAVVALVMLVNSAALARNPYRAAMDRPASMHPTYQRGYYRYHGSPTPPPRLPWWWNQPWNTLR